MMQLWVGRSLTMAAPSSSRAATYDYSASFSSVTLISLIPRDYSSLAQSGKLGSTTKLAHIPFCPSDPRVAESHIYPMRPSYVGSNALKGKKT